MCPWGIYYAERGVNAFCGKRSHTHHSAKGSSRATIRLFGALSAMLLRIEPLQARSACCAEGSQVPPA